MASRRRVVVAAVIGIAIAGSGFAISTFGSEAPQPTGVRTGTATVVRTTITSRQQVVGVLGYGPVTTLVAPLGTTPAQLAQARAAYDAALAQVRSGSAGSAAPDVGAAHAALDRARADYASAKSSANAQMDSASADLRAFATDLATIFSLVDASLGELPLFGSDARVAQSALTSALAPSENARNLATTLLAPSVADYLRARDGVALAVASFDRAADAGANTGTARLALDPALATWTAAETRLRNAVDATTGQIAAVAQAVAGAQSALNAPLTRYNAQFDKTRSDLSALQTLIATEQGRAQSAKAKLSGASAAMNVVSASISSGLATATENLASAVRSSEQATRAMNSAGANAQAQLTAAAANLETLASDSALGPGTVSWLPRLGSVIARGAPIYAVDGRPIPLLIGPLPLYRSLGQGTSGADVQELEDNLVALGYPATPDGTFDANDADALGSWQRSLGVAASGRLEVGEVVVAAVPARIAFLHATVGSPYTPGQPVIDVTASESVVSVSLDASLQSNVRAGDSVSVQIPGRAQAVPGKVAEVGTVAQVPASNQGQTRATINVTVRLDDPSVGASLDQAPVRASITDQVRASVLAVPITSLVARSDGTFVVRVVRDARRVDVVVAPGVFGDSGLVEVTSDGLHAGDVVEVPRAP